MKYAIFVMAILCLSCTTFGQPSVSTTNASIATLRAHRSGVTAVRFSNDGAWLASASLDGTVRLWSTQTWKLLRVLNHRSEVYAIAFSPDGKLLVSGGYDHRLVLWETNSGRSLRILKFPGWINTVIFSTAGNVLVGCSDGIVRTVDSATGTIKHTLDTKRELLSFDISLDGHYVATSSPVRIWDLTSGNLTSKEVHALGQNGIAISPTSKLMASAEGTGGALVLAVPAGESRGALRLDDQKTMRTPTGNIPATINMPASAVAFSRDGKWLATGDSDFRVQLWRVTGDNVETKATRVFTAHTMTVCGVAFSPDGKYLASASLDRTIHIWQLD